MDGHPIIGESDISWSETTTPNSEDFEEVVRQTIPLLTPLNAYSTTRPRFMRPAIRRRLRVEEFACRGKYSPYAAQTGMEPRGSIDGSEASSSSITTVATAATSSTSADAWAPTGFIEEDDELELNWDDQDGDDVLPKLEPIEDVDMSELVDLKEGPTLQTPISPINPTQVKRPRGRPRKYPKPTAESLAKVAKGRSKTGCITCRRRKKKCDETKPSCMNCEKNSVTCEGYPEKTTWKSGREKAEEGTVVKKYGKAMEGLIGTTARIRRASNFALPEIELPPVILGVVTVGDSIFFHHYITRLSLKFTVEGAQESAFRKFLLPMAQSNIGLMHSLLSLSGKHIDYDSPYGRKLLQENPSVNVQTLRERSDFHYTEALNEFRSSSNQTVSNEMYGQMVCFVLQTLNDPNPSGEHRMHLENYKRVIRECPPTGTEYTKFLTEFFQFHISADEIIHLPSQRTIISGEDDWNLPNTVLQPAAVRLLGVFDGLFLYMSKITNIRNKIRHNINNRTDPANPVIDYHVLSKADKIDKGIRTWTPPWPPGDSRDLPGMLYKQMLWIYLFRTITFPQATNWKPDPRITNAVNDGIELLSLFSPDDPSQTLILAPAFVIGCAAFEKEQREPIRKAIGAVKAYMEYKNSDTALIVLEEVWRLMDAKDPRSWDWQKIASELGMDFLAT